MTLVCDTSLVSDVSLEQQSQEEQVRMWGGCRRIRGHGEVLPMTYGSMLFAHKLDGRLVDNRVAIL